MIKFLLLCFFTISLASCGKPELNNSKKLDHFNGKVFHNLNEPKLEKSLIDFIKWRFFSKREKWPKWIETKQHKPPLNRTKEGQASVTFINHATVLIQIDGVNILTDPIFSERASPSSFFGPKRVKNPGTKFEDLPKIDLVLISHNHYDSFDIETLRKLKQRDNPKILLGLGNGYYLDNNTRKDSIEMDWYENYNLKNINFTFLPAKHWSRRYINDTNKSLWGSFAIIGSKKLYFAGDSGYADHFKDIQKKFGEFDFSLIPIGAYEPRWFMKQAHINPEEAVKVHKDTNSKKSMGIHFGTFQLTNEAIDRPQKDLKIALERHKILQEDFFVLKEGESYQIK